MSSNAKKASANFGSRFGYIMVAAGAAIGLLSTEAAYWLGDKITGERSRWHVGTDGQTLSVVVEL